MQPTSSKKRDPSLSSTTRAVPTETKKPRVILTEAKQKTPSSKTTDTAVSSVEEGVKSKKPQIAPKIEGKLASAKLEIDSLFGKAVTKKKQDKEQARIQKVQEEEAEKKEKKLAAEARRALVAGSDTEPRIHRWDQESGLPVYKYYDLRMGEAGSGYTPLCPFDCDCCF